MEGVEASLPSDNAVAQLANPAQTGLFSLHGIASISTFLPPPSFQNHGPSLNLVSMYTWAAEFGTDLQNYLKTPFGISAAIGYSSTGVDAIGGFEQLTFDMKNRANNLTVGLGFSDIVKVGLGVEFNWISSANYMISGEPMPAVAHGYGAIVQVPVLRLIEGGSERDGHNGNGHFANFTIAYALRDLGGYFAYDSNPTDEGTLFRQADIGINMELGIRSTFNGKPWKIFSIMLAREADEPLLGVDSLLAYTNGNYRAYDYYSVYTSFPRYFNPYSNFIAGSSEGKVEIRTGAQLQCAEALYSRAGEEVGPYVGGRWWTIGLGFRSKGLFRILSLLCHLQYQRGSVISFVLNHVDLRYDFSGYATSRFVTGLSYPPRGPIYELSVEIE